LFTTYIKQLSF